MNTIKGMIKDLRREETHIGGCTTKGELIIALESLERSVELPYNATNGDMIKTMFQNCEQKEHMHNGYFEMYFDNELGNASYMRVSKDWWNAPYKGASDESNN
jgi:hypothetical protein